jgi:endonuclease/exonuclease/phosphatase family metal-dependent hydrolase
MTAKKKSCFVQANNNPPTKGLHRARAAWNWLLNMLRRFLLLINLGVVVASLPLLAVAWIPPDRAWPLIFYPYLMLPLLLLHLSFVFWWALGRHKVYAFISLAVVLGGWPLHRTQWQEPIWGQNRDRDQGEIVVMSYNIGHFREATRAGIHVNECTNGIIRLIAGEQPDILCLQEYHSSDRGRGGVTDRLFKECGMQQGYFQRIGGRGLDSRSGMAIFSRHPIVLRRFVPFPGSISITSCQFADLKIGRDTVRVINFHLQSNLIEKSELAQIEAFSQDPKVEQTGSLRMVLGKIRHAARLRSRQAEHIGRLVRESPHPIILCGDLNDLPASYAYWQARVHLQDTYMEGGQFLGNTFAGGFPSFRIDHMFVDPSIEVTRHQVIRQRYSDHYPVVCSARLR